jgi:polyisoprenoid-binding protein YceI
MASSNPETFDLGLAGGSSVQVHGKTNVTPFCCQSTHLELMGPLQASVVRTQGLVQFKGKGFRLATEQLDCGNRLMNKDLKTTLKATEHPHIRFQLKSLEFKKGHGQADGKCTVEMTVSGVSKQVKADFNFILQDDALYLFGKVPLRFSDFGLIPPTRLGGMVKVEQQFEVVFNLYFQPV